MIPDPRQPYSVLVSIAACIVLFLSLLIIVKEAAAKPVHWQKATASWYGPGLFGNTLGCAGLNGISSGAKLYTHTIGVANTSLKCNQKLRLMYGKRKITVRVIDRGPFEPGRQFDLTQAVAKKLKFTGVQEIQWRKKN